MTAEQRITKQTEAILQALMSEPISEWSGSQIAPVAKLKGGTLYPALLRMHRFGWVSWRWEDIDQAKKDGRPRKRFYRLTGTGERVAQEIASEASAREHNRQRKEGFNPQPRGLTV